MATSQSKGAQTRAPQNRASRTTPVTPLRRGGALRPEPLSSEVYQLGMAVAEREYRLEPDPVEADMLVAVTVPGFVKECWDHIRGMRGDFSELTVSAVEMESYTHWLAVRMFRAGYLAAAGGAR